MKEGKIGLFFLSFVMIACTKMCTTGRKDMTPEQVVEAYLQIAFNMKDASQKNLLLEYTSGNLKAAISGATEESLQSAYIKPRYNLKSWSFLERVDQTPRVVEITYHIVYDELPENKKISETVSIDTKNTISLIKEKGKWYIQEVLGSRTSVEFPLLKNSIIKATPLKSD